MVSFIDTNIEDFQKIAKRDKKTSHTNEKK